MFLTAINAHADNHDTQNIIDKAKEINQKVKKQQALKETGIASEVGKEEPLPLNDPFVGDGSLGGGSGIKVVSETEEEKRNLSVFNFKLGFHWLELILKKSHSITRENLRLLSTLKTKLLRKIINDERLFKNIC